MLAGTALVLVGIVAVDGRLWLRRRRRSAQAAK